jgi:SAM-dependent methyltransferase
MERVGDRYAPRQRRAFSSYGGPVETGGDAEQARALAQLFEVDPERARALTHGFHSYAGRMHPTTAHGAIARWSAPGGKVLDPFCGSGTVLVEAAVLGRAARGIDASPLAVGIASVRTTPLGAERRARLVETAAEIAEESAERARKRKRPTIPPWAAKETQRFSPHVALELLGLRALVMATPDDEIGRALRLSLSSLLVKFMRAGPEAPRDGADKRIARGLPSHFFASKVEELARSLEALEQAIPAGTPLPVCQIGDARSYSHVGGGSIDLVVSSPPYAGTYDYAEHHVARFLWLGLPQRRFDETQLGARDRGLGAAPGPWQEGRRRWLGEMGRVLRPGGHVLLAVGDGVVGERLENAATAVAEDAPAANLVPVARASQARPLRDRRLRTLLGPQPRYEHLLLLRREDSAGKGPEKRTKRR